MVPVRQKIWENVVCDWSKLDEAGQRELLDDTIFHPHALLYPPSISYRLAFLKFIIGQLEDCGLEVLDSIYEVYTELLSQARATDTVSYKTYVLRPNCLITLRESVNIVSNGTTGLCTWQAAQCLSEWCLEYSELFSGRSVMELGSGVGLTGLVVCKTCQPSRFFFTDYHDDVLALLHENVQRNLDGENIRILQCQELIADGHKKWLANGDEDGAAGDEDGVATVQGEPLVHDDTKRFKWYGSENSRPSGTGYATSSINGDVSIVRLDWECFDMRYLLENCSNIDIVIAADVIYDVSIIAPLANLLSCLLQPARTSGTCVDRVKIAIICSTIRNQETHDIFLKACEDAGLSHRRLQAPTNQVLYYDRTTLIEVLVLTSSDFKYWRGYDQWLGMAN